MTLSRMILLPLCAVSLGTAQTSMHRKFDLPPLGPNLMYLACDIRQPVQTADKGYIFSYNPWSPNIHNAYPIDDYIIKTDSNFVPQWRKHYTCQAVPLPTGGIMIYYNNGTYDVNGFQTTHIQKITASGALVWARSINADIRINGGVTYGNKVRFIGGKLATAGMYPQQYTTSDPYTIEMDTAGNVLSQQQFAGNGSAEFARIETDAQGNFYLLGGFNSLVLAKFNSSFGLLWSKAYSSSSDPLFLKDIDVLPNGRIIATGLSKGSWGYGPVMGTLLKFDQQGNILAQKFVEGRFSVSGLCRKPNGHYAVTMNSRNISFDSLFIMDVDTGLNVTSNNYMHRGIGVGTPVLKGNALYTPLFDGSPFVVSTDLAGQNCYSVAVTPSLVSTQIALTSFALSLTSFTYAVLTSTYTSLITQTHTDSCACGLSAFQASGCAGNPVTLTASGTGTISWYTSSTGTAVAGTGSTYTFSSSSPVTTTLYIEDNGCVNSTRVPVTVTIYAVPAATVTSSQPTICAGNTAQITLQGNSTYTWSSSTNTSVLTQSLSTFTISPALTTTYSVHVSNSGGCSSTLQFVQFVSACLGLPETSGKIRAAVYPNPATQLLYIKSDHPGVYSLYDLTGRELSSGSYAGTTSISLSDLPAGIYFLRLQQKEEVMVVKVVKSSQ
jgi:hypothetical protein